MSGILNLLLSFSHFTVLHSFSHFTLSVIVCLSSLSVCLSLSLSVSLSISLRLPLYRVVFFARKRSLCFLSLSKPDYLVLAWSDACQVH